MEKGGQGNHSWLFQGIWGIQGGHAGDELHPGSALGTPWGQHTLPGARCEQILGLGLWHKAGILIWPIHGVGLHFRASFLDLLSFLTQVIP